MFISYSYNFQHLIQLNYMIFKYSVVWKSDGQVMLNVKSEI